MEPFPEFIDIPGGTQHVISVISQYIIKSNLLMFLDSFLVVHLTSTFKMHALERVLFLSFKKTHT